MNLNELYRLAASGDNPAEKELFEYLLARFHYLARQSIMNAQDREEVVQNALLAIISNYRQTRIEISFAAWAHKVLENKIIDFLRHKSAVRAKYDYSEMFLETQPAKEIGYDFKSRLKECLKKINAVNKRHARILVLSYQGFNIEEICRRLKITRNNCYSVLSRARSMLEKCLEKGTVE